MMPFNTIIIEIEGGVLQDVHNLPEGWSYYLEDHDNQKEMPELVPVKDDNVYFCPCCDMALLADPGEITERDEQHLRETACPNCNVLYALVRNDDERLR